VRMRFPGFVGPSYVSQSPVADAERTVNLYPEALEVAGKQQGVLYPTPGFTAFVTLPDAPVRGLFALNDRAFAVGGATLYEVFTGGTATARSAILSNDGAPVTISSNGDGGGQLFLTSGGKGYIYDLGANTLTQVLSSAHFGAFIDGYFVALDIAAAQAKSSALLDGTSWPGASFAQRLVGPDTWKAIAVSYRDLWLFGSHSTDVWYNAGLSDFPFAPTPNVVNQGIVAPYSVALLGSSPVWLSQNQQGAGIVVLAEGYQPRRISTHALEYALSQYASLADAVGWTYQDQGHTHYVLSFPSAGATWVYDVASGTWHERGYWSSADMAYQEYRVRSHMFAFGHHLVGDRTTGTIYRMDIDLATDVDGTGIRRLRRTPHLSATGTRITYWAMEVELETGIGIAVGQGSDPQIMAKWSDDYGRTFGNEHWTSAGAIGAYRTRAIWRRLGSGRNRVFEVSLSDPVPWRVVDCFLDVDQARH